MRIAIASDHRGFKSKQRAVPHLRQAGHELIDFGCDSTESCDYMDYAHPAAQAVAQHKADAGLLFDGSGIGMSIVANKVYSVRAAVAHDEISARTAREKNHCNILCLGCDLLSEPQVRRIIHAFLTTEFGVGRHARRVAKLSGIERAEFTALGSAPAGPARSADAPTAPTGWMFSE